MILLVGLLIAARTHTGVVGNTTDSYVEVDNLDIQAYDKTTIHIRNTGTNSMTAKLFGYTSYATYDSGHGVPLEFISKLGVSSGYELAIADTIPIVYENKTAAWYYIGVELKSTSAGDSTSYYVEAQSWGQ